MIDTLPPIDPKEARIHRLEWALAQVVATITHPEFRSLWDGVQDRLRIYAGPSFDIAEITAALEDR